MPVAVQSVSDSLTPSQAAEALETCIRMRQSACLWGGPGIGKSDVLDQVSRRLGVEKIAKYAATMDATDINGIPAIIDGRTVWITPEFLPRGGTGILFWDDLTRASTMVMNGIFQLILEGKNGSYVLPPGWVCIAASNRVTDGGGVTKMPSALSNRFVHIDMQADLDDWCRWALTHDVEPMLIAFLRFKSNHLNAFDPKQNAFPTPRSWSFVNKLLGQQASAAIEFHLIRGSVGQAAATDFTAFKRMYESLPNIDAILADPANAPVPKQDNVGTLYAVAAALAHRANAENFGRVTTYLDRMPPEFNVYAVKDAIMRDASLQSTKPFVDWAVAHSGVTF